MESETTRCSQGSVLCLTRLRTILYHRCAGTRTAVCAEVLVLLLIAEGGISIKHIYIKAKFSFYGGGAGGSIGFSVRYQVELLGI